MSPRDGIAISVHGASMPAETLVALSSEQARVWELHHLEPDGTQNLTAAVRLRGPLDLPPLLRRLDAVAERHDLLRSAFPVHDGRPHQWVRLHAPQELMIIDLRGFATGQRDAEAHGRAACEAARAFDLAHGPAWRTILLRLGEHEHQLVVSAHALVADRRSLRLLISELVGDERAAHASAPIARGDDDPLSYWQHLDGVGRLELASEPPTSRASRRSARHALTFPDPLCTQLAQLGAREGLTLDVTMLALFVMLLHRQTGQTDIAVGTRCVHPADELVGPRSSMLMLRTDLSGMPSGLECLRRVTEVARAGRAHRLPYEELVDALGLPPAPQVVFACDERPALAAAEWVEIDLGTTTAELALELFDDGPRGAPRLAGHLEYDCDLFDAATIARIADHLLRLAQRLVETPAEPVALFPIVFAAEQHQLLNRARGAVDLSVPNCAAHALFEAQVDRTPAATALVWHGGSWTYEELDRRANQLARRLVRMGVGHETLVCVYIDRSPEMIVALLAILKAGGAYVPMDPGYPAERLAHVLETTQTPLLVTRSALVPSLPDHELHTLCLDTDWPTIAEEDPARLGNFVSPSQLAYVIFTSGLTGTPKGVMIEHRALVHYTTAATHTYEISPRDRILQFSSISFDASVEEIFPTLTSGATLALRRSSTLDPAPQFLAHCNERGITVLSLPTAYWHELVAALARQEATLPASLRLMIIGGERASPAAWSAWHQHAPPRVRLLNTYGPSETTVVTTVWDAAYGKAEVSTVPIGRPLPHACAYVLDAHRQLVPVGVPGELYIGGATVGRGYLRAPALTSERFGNDPFSPDPRGRLFRTGDRCRLLANGSLEFLGRTDDQLKLAGHRIEPGEIEARLREHPGVKDAAVVASSRDGQLRLHGFVVPRPGVTPRPTEQQLRSHLWRWLLPHLIPSLTLLDALPLTVSGKIDRAALLAHKAAPSPAIDGPRDPIEELLHELFGELLPGKTIGIRDDFFALGGDSLSAVELLAKLHARLDVDLPAHCVFEHPTVESLAHAIVAHIHGERERAAVTADELASDARLDPSIRRAAAVTAPASPRTLFVTGATGFFGAFVLADLLAATSAQIKCLVRASSEQEAQTRLVAALHHHFPTCAVPLERVTAVPGDLAKPRLGLSDAAFATLAAGVDAIYHAGATVHYLRPYRALRASNVLGTEEVLRLAVAEKTKPLHHISSLGVFGRSEHAVCETTPLGDGSDLGDGYSQTKWVSEQLVLQAQQAGIPIAIYRPGRLTGHSRTGASNPSDLLSNLVQACVHLGAAPELELLVDMVPVDFASAALVNLSSDPASLGKTFHLGHPQPIEWHELVAALESFGYRMRQLPYEGWTAAVRQYATHRRAGRALLSVGGLSLRELSDALAASYDCRATLQALSGSSIHTPAIDSRLLRAGLSYLVRTGLLHPPHERR